MKALIIGASGTIGKAIVAELRGDTDIVAASLNNKAQKVDMGDHSSIRQLLERVGKLDAIICAAARGVIFKSITDMSIDDYNLSLQQKFFGQVCISLEGIKYLNDGGSITLTTGILNRHLVKNGSAAAIANNAVEAFVKSASLDLPRGIRINAVSPALLEESALKYKDLCPGFETVSSNKVARAYRKSVYGIESGKVFHVN
jgi:NAD(P)-dependent dehydrogenase (short-subunit alcohol dehydrogenase family)